MSDAKLPRELSFSELKEIASILKSSDSLAEFSLKFGNVELALSTHNAQGSSSAPIVERGSPAVSSAQTLSQQVAVKESGTPSAAVDICGHVVKSPMIGTFYRAPEPGADPFVKVGDLVKKGDVICLIEVMKLINSITAEHDGRVTEIFVENATPVEFGQPIMAIELI
jgi:acetyl-CoA carboxylase biotin carboxyl carrier protein